MAIKKTLFLIIFVSTFVNSINVFDCRLSGAFTNNVQFSKLKKQTYRMDTYMPGLGCQKMSQYDSSFEYPQPMDWLRIIIII